MARAVSVSRATIDNVYHELEAAAEECYTWVNIRYRGTAYYVWRPEDDYETFKDACDKGLTLTADFSHISANARERGSVLGSSYDELENDHFTINPVVGHHHGREDKPQLVRREEKPRR